jgi:hypothetical protein
MKKIIVVLPASFILTAFSTKKDSAIAFDKVTELQGYKLRNTAIDFHDFNIWVVTTEDVFDKEFISESSTATRPRFEDQLVLAVKVETLSFSYAVKFRSMTLKDKNLNVYFGVRKEGPAKNGEGPVSLAVVPKDSSVKKINFFHDNVLVKSVPIAMVY